MQRSSPKAGPRRFVPLASIALAALLAIVPLRADAADNTATGDIAGVDADLGDSNTFTLNATTLALVKTAFRSGVELTSGATLPRGTLVQFMIYIDNPTGITVSDVNVSDVLDPGFGYQVNSIKVDNSAATGSTAADIYLAVNAAGTVTDANDGDVAGISGPTITAGSTGGNGQLDIGANAVWAILFDVTVQ